MPVTRDQFDAGMTYGAYKAQMTRNRDQVEQNEKDLQLSPDDVQAIRNLPRRLNVLALAEDWCGDVVANLPILGRLAEVSNGTLNLRILLRDGTPGSTVMDEHLKAGQFKSIPTVIFLDDGFRELGVWIERPDSVTALREQRRQELYRDHPEWGDSAAPIAELAEDVRVQVQQATADVRAEIKPFANAEVVRELRAIAERAAGVVTA